MSRLKKAYDNSLDQSNIVIPGTPLYPQDYFKARDPKLLKERKEKHERGEYVDWLTLTAPTMTGTTPKLNSKTRLRKVAELVDGYMSGGDQYEVYKNPTDREVGYVKKESSDGGVRGVIYDDGTIYIWPSDTLHHYINNKISVKIDVENAFRFAGYGNGDWIMDAHNKYTVEETIELIKKYKDILKRFGNTSKWFNIFYANGSPNYYEFSLDKDNSPTKDAEERERKKKEKEEACKECGSVEKLNADGICDGCVERLKNKPKVEPSDELNDFNLDDDTVDLGFEFDEFDLDDFK